jgi:hypothetical protein
LAVLRVLLDCKDAVAPSLVTRDGNGATPLHAAILKGYTPIVTLLISASPPEVLYFENGVGSTALELASLAAMRVRLRSAGTTSIQASGFSAYTQSGYPVSPLPGVRPEDEEDIKSTRMVIDNIRALGSLAKTPELLETLASWIRTCEDQLQLQKSSGAGSEDQDSVDSATITSSVPLTTFDVLSRAVVQVPTRSLIHLSDIQQTVLDTVEFQAKQNPRIGQVVLPDQVAGYGLEEKEYVKSGCTLLSWTPWGNRNDMWR